MDKPVKILDWQEVNTQFFDGRLTYQALLYRARMGYIPSIKIGRKVFFEQTALVDFFREKAKSSCLLIHSKDPTERKDIPAIPGIRRIV